MWEPRKSLRSIQKPRPVNQPGHRSRPLIAIAHLPLLSNALPSNVSTRDTREIVTITTSLAVLLSVELTETVREKSHVLCSTQVRDVSAGHVMTFP